MDRTSSSFKDVETLGFALLVFVLVVDAIARDGVVADCF